MIPVIKTHIEGDSNHKTHKIYIVRENGRFSLAQWEKIHNNGPLGRYKMITTRLEPPLFLPFSPFLSLSSFPFSLLCSAMSLPLLPPSFSLLFIFLRGLVWACGPVWLCGLGEIHFFPVTLCINNFKTKEVNSYFCREQWD